MCQEEDRPSSGDKWQTTGQAIFREAASETEAASAMGNAG